MTGRFVSTRNTAESGEGKFETYADDLPVEIQGADPATSHTPPTATHPRMTRWRARRPVLRCVSAARTAAWSRWSLPRMRRTRSMGQTGSRAAGRCARFRAGERPHGLPCRGHRWLARPVNTFSRPADLHHDEEFEQARLFSVDRRHNGLNVNPGVNNYVRTVDDTGLSDWDQVYDAAATSLLSGVPRRPRGCHELHGAYVRSRDARPGPDRWR